MLLGEITVILPQFTRNGPDLAGRRVSFDHNGPRCFLASSVVILLIRFTSRLAQARFLGHALVGAGIACVLERDGEQEMKTALTVLAFASSALALGCQSSKPAGQAAPVAVAPREDAGVWGGLVLNGLNTDSQYGTESYRNDSADGWSATETPDFVDRSWMLTRRYEDLRVSNGTPGEYSHSVTRTVTRGPGR